MRLASIGDFSARRARLASQTTETGGREKRRGEPHRAWSSTESSLLSGWGHSAEAAKHAHYLRATVLRRRNLWLGIPAVAASAIVGTSLFASLVDDTTDLGPEVRLAIGGLSVAAAVLSATQTFLRFAERSERHVQAADWYAAITRKIDQLLALPSAYRGDPTKVLDALRKEMSEAGQTSPEIGEKVWHRVAGLYGVGDPPYERHAKEGRPT